MTEPQNAACLTCRTTGGTVRKGDVLPARIRGNCVFCYNRAYAAGTHTALPLARTARQCAVAARCDRGVPMVAGRTHRYAPQMPAWRVTVAYEERRAAAWLRARGLAA